MECCFKRQPFKMLKLKDGTALAFKLFEPISAQQQALILIGGAAMVKEDLKQEALMFAQNRRVLTLDSRGAGATISSSPQFMLETCAQDTLALAQHVGFDTFDLVGLSMGGMIAQLVAILAPQSVRRLVIGCCSHGGPNALPIKQSGSELSSQSSSGQVLTTTDRRERTRIFLQQNYTDNLVAKYPEEFERRLNAREQYKRSGTGFMQQIAAIRQMDSSRELYKIQCPTLIMHGSKDQITPPGNSELLAKAIPNSRLVMFPDAGHFFWHFDNGLVMQQIMTFLDQNDTLSKL